MTGQHTLNTEAARPGQDQLWCSGCQDWHQAGAFPADGRRRSGRASTCRQAIQAAVRAELAAPAPLPPRPPCG